MVTAACKDGASIAAIAKAAGITRQTVYNWTTDYGGADRLTASYGTPLTELPVQRPHALQGAPVLILSKRRGKWDGRLGKAVGYAGDRLGVRITGKIADVIAESWALAGDSSGDGRRPEAGDLVIGPEATLGTVLPDTGDHGDIVVDVNGSTSRCSWWAIVLPAAADAD